MRNSDLDAATGIVRCLAVGLLLWSFAAFGFAASSVEFYGCGSAASVGVTNGECSSQINIPAASLDGSSVVLYCHNQAQGPLGDDGCLSGEWNYWSERWEFGAIALSAPAYLTVWISDAEGVVYAAGGGLGGGGDPGEPSGEWTLEDLDLSKGASAFGAAFMVVAMFWALGKSVALVVGFLRSR